MGEPQEAGVAASPGTEPPGERTSMILTPDQRVRVFISSTLEELAAERAAARRAIARLHLVPVWYESGARPYPPRSMYRAYLEQSQVFVGIYWQRYGWVAPGMGIESLGLAEPAAVLAGVALRGPLAVLSILPPAERDDRAVLLERVRTLIGRTTYERVLTRGAAMNADEVVTYALEQLDAAESKDLAPVPGT